MTSMKSRKFCMVTTFYPPYNFGGDGIFIERLVHALAADGQEVHVVHDRDAYELLAGPSPDLPAERRPGVTVHTLRRNRFPRLELLLSHQLGRPIGANRGIQAVLDNHEFDVVHYHNISLLGGPNVLQYGRGIKLCTMHDYWFVCPMHVLWRNNREPCAKRTCLSCTLRGRRPPQLWRYTGSLERAARHVDAFIAPSRSACLLQAKNGFPAPVHLIPNFLPAGDTGPAEARPDEPVHPRPYFLFVGRLEKIKGVQVLLDLFREYHAADLLIAGAGVYEGELRALAHGLSHVHFLGRLDHTRLQSFYRQAIAVVVPSLCFETFGFVAIEAFATKTPVIVHDIGALPEVVTTTGGGLIYRTPAELREAVERLRTEPGLRRELGEQGYRGYLEHYTEAPHLRQYYALIDQIERRRADSRRAPVN